MYEMYYSYSESYIEKYSEPIYNTYQYSKVSKVSAIVL